MPNKEAEAFNPDLSSITFPSERITLGQMRKVEPEWFSTDREMLDNNLVVVHGINALRVEQILARKAWAEAIGLPDPDTFHSRATEVEYLTDIYKDYGISTGPQQTEELVRRFETEAAKLAKISAGQSR